MLLLCVDMTTVHKGAMVVNGLVRTDLINGATIGNVRQLSPALSFSAIDLISDQVECIHLFTP